METVHILHWQVEVDPAATALAHKRRSTGGAEECPCLECSNFAAARERAFPAQFRTWLERLGIPLDRESEVFHYCEMEDATHLYGGWFHFVGRILDGPGGAGTDQATDPEPGNLHPLQEGFDLGLSQQAQMLPDTFPPGPVVQLEFTAEVPWVLAEE